MKSLTSILLAGFLICGNQATAKQNPPIQKVGNWNFVTQYDDMNNDPGYTIYALSSDRSTVISLGCTIDQANDSKIIYLGSFFTKKTFENVGNKADFQFQYRVDDKPMVDDTFKQFRGGSSDIDKIMTVSITKITRLISNLRNGKTLTFSFNTDDEDIQRQKFDIKGFNEAFEKVKGVCKF